MEVETDPLPRRLRRRQKQPKKTQDHASTILEIPSHITCDIVSRLPLKTIFSCKRVCSSFRNLTLEPYFPQLHLPRSPLSLILHRPSDSLYPTSFGFLTLGDSLVDLSRRRATVKFETNIEYPAGSRLGIVDSCHGLICLADYICPNKVYICNPITRQHFSVPECKNEPSTMSKRPHFHWYWYGFGCSRSTELHKVVKFTANFEKLPYRLNCSVYTLGVDNEWRTVGNTGQPLPIVHRFVFFKGALHWISSGDSTLVLSYFDMEKEQCGSLPVPNLSGPSRLKGTEFHLGVVENCLYIRDERKSQLPVKIWVMKDYGNIGSWTLEWIIQRPLPSGLDRDLRPVKTLECGRVLMIAREKTLASYNPLTGVFEKISYQGVQFWKESIADVPSFLPIP